MFNPMHLVYFLNRKSDIEQVVKRHQSSIDDQIKLFCAELMRLMVIAEGGRRGALDLYWKSLGFNGKIEFSDCVQDLARTLASCHWQHEESQSRGYVSRHVDSAQATEVEST